MATSKNKQTGIIPFHLTRLELAPRLPEMIHCRNDYVESFKCALENALTHNFNIIIDADKRPTVQHPGWFNEPHCNEIAMVLHDNIMRDIVLK